MPSESMQLLAIAAVAVVAAVIVMASRRTGAQKNRAGAPAAPATRDAPGTGHGEAERPRAAGRAAPGRPLLAGVTSWGYQLQHLDIAQAAASPYDLLVIDYSRDGSAEGALKPAELDRLKRKKDGTRRLVVAYLSIGEAESYRFYWNRRWKKEKPGWLLGENPEWEENYSVCFWEPDWQRLMCGSPDAYLDRIMAAGFDGIYLDKCDVFEDLEKSHKRIAASRPDIEGDMVAFVRRISAYAKSRDPSFVIIMQNAETLLEDEGLREAIDGVGKEELLFGLDGPERRNSKDDVSWSRRLLDLAAGAGKKVLMVEYLDDPKKMAEAADKAESLGYVLYVSAKDRELDRLSEPGTWT